MNNRGLHDLGEDSTGLGRVELRTIRDALIRPRQQLEIYMTGQPTGDGRYARPLRLYLTLCGLMMLILLFSGGTEMMVAGLPDPALSQLIEASGKSRDAYIADADNWISLVLVPIMSAAYALGFAPLLRAWDRDDLGWRKGFRAAFVYLNAATVPIVPFTWMAYNADTILLSTLLIAVVMLVTFLRMGRGRWYQSTVFGVLKGLALLLAMQIVGLLGYFVVIPVGLLGALLTP